MRRTLGSPFAVGVASRIGAQVSAFALILVASRSLDLAEFGAYAIASALAVIFTTLVYTGVYHILMRSPDIHRDRDTFFVLQLGIGLVGSVLMVGIAFILGGPSGGSTPYAMLGLAPIPVFASLSAWLEAQLVREGRIRTTSTAVLASEVVGLVTALTMFRSGFGIDALIASRLASMAFIVVIYGSLVRRAPRLRVRLDTARDSLCEAWPLWGSVSLSMMSNYGADLMLGAFLNASSVGAYRAGARVANTAADVVIQPLGTISWARFARLEANSTRELIRDAWKENMAVSFALVVPAMISLSLLAEPLVSFLLDPAWGAASGVVAIIALARATNAITFLLEPTLTCLGRVRLQFYINVGDAALFLLLLLTFGRAGAEAAAYSILAKDMVLMTSALVAMMLTARLTLADLVETITPGLGLTAICLLVILGMTQLPSDMTPVASFAVTVAALLSIWLLTVAGMLRRRVLVLPRP